MIYFLDASALVKRYIEEPGSDAIRYLVRKRRQIAVSSLSALEVPAALFRRARQGDLEMRSAQALVARVVADLDDMHVVEVRAKVLELAVSLASQHPLRAFDAAQLACAVRLARSTRLAVTFGCTDAILRAAAQAEGLRLMPLP